MDKPNKKRRFQSSTILTMSGAATALFVMVSLYPGQEIEPTKISSDPVISRVLTEFKTLTSQGKWNDAANLLASSELRDHAALQFEMGKLYARGWGVPLDTDKALINFLQAVRIEFPKRGEAAFELARLYQRGSGPDCPRLAFEWLSKAVEWGHHKAHAELGKHYARGIGVETDFSAALGHFRAAARGGSATALVSFANLLSTLSPDDRGNLNPSIVISEAVPLLETEAFQGKASASKALGRLYSSGKFIGQDWQLAEKWFRRGAQLEDSGSMLELALMLIERKERRQPTDEADIVRFLTRAAELNNGGAMTALGRLHLVGKFGLDPREAADCFRAGVKAGHAGSMAELAQLHLDGSLVERNLAKARELALRGAALGHKGSRSLSAKIEKMFASDRQDTSNVTSPNLTKRG